MNQIQWDDKKFGVLVAEMDEQHKQLIALFNEVNETFTGTESEITSEEAMRKLLDFTRQHFAKEEQFMRKIDFPDYEAHKKTHAYFVTKLQRIEDELEAGYWVPRKKTIDELWDCLEDHIINEDKCYGEFHERKH